MRTAKLARNLMAALLGSAALMMSGGASAIVVGGVDFGPQGLLQHIETTTLAETYINGNGQNLQGYGQINTVNGNVFYAGTDRLYFHFYNYISNNFTPNSVGFTGGVVDVYKGQTFNLLNQSSPANIAIIQGMQPWVRLTGHASAPGSNTLDATGFLDGVVLSFTGAGLLDVAGGFGLASVISYLDVSNIIDGLGGFADIALSSSGDNKILNPNDNLTGCFTGQAQPGQWCIAGSADIRGNTNPNIPEPATVVLLGAALLGLGATGRKRKG